MCVVVVVVGEAITTKSEKRNNLFSFFDFQPSVPRSIIEISPSRINLRLTLRVVLLLLLVVDVDVCVGVLDEVLDVVSEVI